MVVSHHLLSSISYPDIPSHFLLRFRLSNSRVNLLFVRFGQGAYQFVSGNFSSEDEEETPQHARIRSEFSSFISLQLPLHGKHLR